MAKYSKSSGISGAWLKNSEVESGSICKLVGEVNPIPDNFNEGKFQDVGKIRFEGEAGEAKNVRLNRATINALVDAFGEESKEWMGQPLKAHTEKMVVAGKRVTALYLIPEGYKMGEDENGYVIIVKEKLERPESIKKQSIKKPAYPTPEDEGVDPDLSEF